MLRLGLKLGHWDFAEVHDEILRRFIPVFIDVVVELYDPRTFFP